MTNEQARPTLDIATEIKRLKALRNQYEESDPRYAVIQAELLEMQEKRTHTQIGLHALSDKMRSAAEEVGKYFYTGKGAKDD